MPPFPKISRIGLTFGLDLSPTDLNINKYHLLIMDDLPTRFEGSGAKHFELSVAKGVGDKHAF